jgi:acid phosphatase
MKLLSGRSRSATRFFSSVLLSALLITVILAAGCGAGTAGTTSSTGTVPQFSHVVIVMEENASYSDVIGSNSMPYLNSLATKYAVATQYFGDVHPSIGNYMMLTTGTLATLDDNFSGTISSDNLARQFAKDGKTWKVYAEGIPSAGYLGGDTGLYLKHHNPFAYFTDVTTNPTQAANIVPFTQFGSDVSAGTLPNFSLVVPNSADDGHDCPGGALACPVADRLAPADAWLHANIQPLIASSMMTDTLLVIVFDEGELSDLQNGGGHVPAVVVSPKAKQGFQGVATYQHQNLLRTLGQALSLSSIPGEGATAGNMGEFF